jgi:hypothetical protein
MIAALAEILGTMLAALVACLVAARAGVLRVTLTRPAKPKPKEGP